MSLRGPQTADEARAFLTLMSAGTNGPPAAAAFLRHVEGCERCALVVATQQPPAECCVTGYPLLVAAGDEWKKGA